MNIATKRTTRWEVPARSPVRDVALIADGSLLAYRPLQKPSVVRVIPTTAATATVAGNSPP